ncbi:MAG: outer membrane beta-barrel family protein [Bacteroidota bacterium]
MLQFTFKNRLFLLAILLSLAGNSLAQLTVSGIVSDSEGAPVSFANVFLKNSTSEEIVSGEISGDDGAFQLQVADKGSYTLVISFVGFADWSKDLELTQSVNLGSIELKPFSSELDEVVVTAERNIIEKRDNVIIFNVDQSPMKQGFDGMEVLRRSPSVLIDSYGMISIRNDLAKVMINGRPSNLSGEELSSYIENLRSEDIKSIQVQTHLAANTDGENAGGVINIILKKKPVGFDASFRADHTFMGGGDHHSRPGFNFNYGAEKWNVYGAYNFNHFNQISPVLYETDYFQTDDFINDDWNWDELIRFHTSRLGFVAEPVKNHSFGLEAFVRNFIFDFENQGLVTIREEGNISDIGDARFNGITDNDLYNTTFNYTWTTDTLGSALKLFAEYSRQKVVADNFSTSSYRRQQFTGSTERADYELNTNIFAAQIDYVKNFSSGLTFEAGSRINFVSRDNQFMSELLVNNEWKEGERTNSFLYEEDVMGAYAMASKKFGEKNFLQVGLRFEQTDVKRTERADDFQILQKYPNWFPSVYFSRDLKNDNSLSLSYTKRISRPPFYVLSNYVLRYNDFSYEVGNPAVRPEFINKFEVSFKQPKQTFSAYYEQIDDVMKTTHTLDEDQITTYFIVLNRGVERYYGLDYNRFGNINKWWFIKATLGLFQTHFTDNERGEDLRRFSGNLFLSNNFKLNKTTSFDLSGSYSSPTNSGFCTTQEMYSIDGMVQKTFFNDRMTFRVYVTDIFNTLLFEHDCGFPDFNTAVNHKQKTRTFRLWMSYNFSTKNKFNKRTIESKGDVIERFQ